MTHRQARLLERLQEALDHAGNTHTLVDVIEAARRGEAQVWEHDDSIAITEVLRSPRRTTVRIWLAAGSLEGLLPLQPALEAWAAAQGASRIEVIGRRGWAAVARAAGYQPVATVFAKDMGQ